jgi:hypothetical protein
MSKFYDTTVIPPQLHLIFGIAQTNNKIYPLTPHSLCASAPLREINHPFFDEPPSRSVS